MLDALGVRIDHDAVSAGAALRDIGFAFLFAPNFHPAMRHAGPTRKEIGVRTAFNLLGPLTNPAGHDPPGRWASATPRAAGRFAEVVQRLGTERTFVVHGDGVDELPLDGSGVLYEVRPDGRRAATPSTRVGAGPAVAATARAGRRRRRRTNARLIEAVLRGEPGARRDVVLLNAGAALARRRRVDDLEGGIERAALTIDAGLDGRAARAAAGRAAPRPSAAAAGDHDVRRR